jgi:hypothetical protein
MIFPAVRTPRAPRPVHQTLAGQAACERSASLEVQIPGDGYCDWLYYCPAFDAHGKVRSCAIPDYASQGSRVYGDIAVDGADYFNSARFQAARHATVGRAPLLPPLAAGAISDEIGCVRCPHRPSPCSPLRMAASWQRSIGSQLVPSDMGAAAAMQRMSGWSQHNHQGPGISVALFKKVE